MVVQELEVLGDPGFDVVLFHSGRDLVDQGTCEEWGDRGHAVEEDGQEQRLPYGALSDGNVLDSVSTVRWKEVIPPPGGGEGDALASG